MCNAKARVLWTGRPTDGPESLSMGESNLAGLTPVVAGDPARSGPESVATVSAAVSAVSQSDQSCAPGS